MQAIPHYPAQALETDEATWALFREGNREALGQLYFRYFRLLVQYGSGITSDRGLVRDCIHDIFVELWNRRRHLAMPRSVKAYLLVSVRRKLLRAVRRARFISSPVDNDDSQLVVESKEAQMIRDQHTADQHEMLRQAMLRLTRRQREAIYLRYYANLSYAEITAVMKISSDAIYNLVSNAIDALQQHMPVITR